MLIHDQQYLEALRETLKGAQNVSMAVAFWGTGGESLFERWKGKSLRIICNLALGGTNPKVISELVGLNNATVRQLDNLHAKLVLTDREMIVGSANISSNGLGLEAGETAGFRELGIVSRDAEQLKAARAWFEDLWKVSRQITLFDLEKAKEAWNKQRGTRPETRRSSNLLEHQAEDLRDRPIYFAVFRSGLSQEAKERLAIQQKEMRKPGPNDGQERTKLDVYDGWDFDDLPKDPSAVIIPIYWGPRGKIEICPPQRPIPELEDSYGDAGEECRLDFTAIIAKPNANDLPFIIKRSGREQEELVGLIRQWLPSLKDRFDDGDDGLCVPVYEFLRWREINNHQ